MPLLLSLQSYAQQEVNIGGMNFRYEIIHDSIYGFLSAPTRGWIMIGFNSKNSVEGADFKFFRMVNGTVEVSDRKNIGNRTYPSDVTLGGKNNVRVLKGAETVNRTSIYFVFPFQTKDVNDFQHRLNESFWLILAYSQDDDFLHHSRMRKHLPFSWEPQ